MNFALGSNLSQDSLQFTLLRTLKIIYLYVKIFCLGIAQNYFLHVKLCLKESSISKLLYRILKIIFYEVNNNCSYNQLSFAFLLQKDSYSDPNDIDTFFLFLIQRDFFICSEPLFCLFSFSSSERF